MNIGDHIESAIWMDGTETVEQRKEHEAMIQASIGSLCAAEGYTHGPVQFTEKHPMDDRVPEVPDHISGPNVRLLVAETVVTGNAVESPRGSFVAQLEKSDLGRLRAATRRAHKRYHPNEPPLKDETCDRYIEALGPEAALETLRKETRVSRYH